MTESLTQDLPDATPQGSGNQPPTAVSGETVTAAPPAEIREFHFKILVVGDSGSGKTSILQRYISGTFSTKFKITIGVDFLLKTMNWGSNTFLRLQFWDIAGQERFGHMTPMYYREAAGAFVVYDLTSPSTFDAVPKWKADLDAHLSTDDGPLGLPVVLLANKSDIFDETLDKARMERFCQENGFITWFCTSAKEDKNIREAVDCLIGAILQREMPPAPTAASKKGTVNLSEPTKPQKEPCSC